MPDIAANARPGKDAPPISPIFLEAVKRIGVLFGTEREINGVTPSSGAGGSGGTKGTAG